MLKRLKNELNEFKKYPNENFNVSLPNINDLYSWNAIIYGPKDTIYENGKFNLSIFIPEHYPFEPPVIKFITPIYHPNISINGDICLNIIRDEWSPILCIRQVLLGICVLLDNPNPDDPLRNDIADIYKSDIKQYEKNVIEHIKQFSEK
jgi:ubiquitin-conjugating enzyme E2 D/E